MTSSISCRSGSRVRRYCLHAAAVAVVLSGHCVSHAEDIFNTLSIPTDSVLQANVGWGNDAGSGILPGDDPLALQYKHQSIVQNFSINRGYDVSALSFLSTDSSRNPVPNAAIYKFDPVTRVMTPTGFYGTGSSINGVATVTSATPVHLDYGVYSLVFSDTRVFTPDANRNIPGVVRGSLVLPSRVGISEDPASGVQNSIGRTGEAAFLGGARKGVAPALVTPIPYDTRGRVAPSELPTYLTPVRYTDGTSVPGPIDPTKSLQYAGSNPESVSTLPYPVRALGSTATMSFIPLRLQGTANGSDHPFVQSTDNLIYDSQGKTGAFRPAEAGQTVYSIAGYQYQKRTATFVASGELTDLAIKFCTDLSTFNFARVKVTDTANPGVNIVNNGDLSAPGPVNGNVVVKQYQYTKNGQTIIAGQTDHPDQQPTGWTFKGPTFLNYVSTDLVDQAIANPALFPLDQYGPFSVLPVANDVYDPATTPYLYPDLHTALGSPDLEADTARFVTGTDGNDKISVTRGVVNEGLTMGESAYHAVSLGGFSTLSQVVDTIPGHTYEFEYYERNGISLGIALPIVRETASTTLLAPSLDLLAGPNVLLKSGQVGDYDGTEKSLRENGIPYATEVLVYATAVVPEPTSLGLIGLAGVGLLRRRARQANR